MTVGKPHKNKKIHVITFTEKNLYDYLRYKLRKNEKHLIFRCFRPTLLKGLCC